jgi:hypothetical protein
MMGFTGVDIPPPLSLELFMEDTTSLLFGSVSEYQLSEGTCTATTSNNHTCTHHTHRKLACNVTCIDTCKVFCLTISLFFLLDNDAIVGGMVDACDMFDCGDTPSAPSSSCASPTPEVDSRFCFSAIALHTSSPVPSIGRAPDDSARLSSEAVQKAAMKKKKGRGRPTRRHHGGSTSTSPRVCATHSSPRVSLQRERRFSPMYVITNRTSFNNCVVKPTIRKVAMPLHLALRTFSITKFFLLIFLSSSLISDVY